ncbi:MAG TPA: GNAT family N-acetyltransferase [Streptomyces sp.]|uniref:GNAT family N-acetyltransferase n=1 Tax=Streptomyces sp. TaxID=1931 RepID=UPI002D6CACBE|nr:GNAT family N-acetyltransferase [Streptomyces sp.]HZG04664.1 GNAT family N-acetyltransferase [Streptomyces sp.]
MPDRHGTLAVTALSRTEWTRACARSTPVLPFTDHRWIALGLAGSPGTRFAPVALHNPDGGTTLVPLCLTPEGARVGCFGYGSLLTPGGEPDTPWPDFGPLAARLGAELGFGELRTLLPPPGVVPALDRAAARWPHVSGPVTYLLDLSRPDPLAAARGSVRTALRRARSEGLGPVPVDTSSVLRLYRETMARNGVPARYGPGLLDALLGASGEPERAAADTVVTAVGRRGVAHAVAVFAVAGPTAYHIMQLTSDEGRSTNAGHLALWTAVDALRERAVATADLGSARSPGQDRFKIRCGAAPVATRLVRWPFTEEGDR